MVEAPALPEGVHQMSTVAPQREQSVNNAIREISHIATLPEITVKVVELVEDAKLGRRVFAAIRAEWDRSHEALWLITGEGDRLHSNPALARSIAHRFPYVDPLHHLQVELLRRYRHRNPDDAAVERLKSGIHLSINGIAAGLRNTG